MNEDMEKKTFPSSPSTSKTPESPRNKDGSGGSSQLVKSYPKAGRCRRESPSGIPHGSNTVPTRNNEHMFRKQPTSQKSKAVEKKPPKQTANLNETAQDDHPEMGSLQTPGSKKRNLNHLLNFHFAPRENQFRADFQSHGGPNRMRLRHHSGTHKFNKTDFLQSNCQFMVKPTGDYTIYKADPDLLVEWDLIEQIAIRTVGGCQKCPICLDFPIAAQMTRCGHIYCWPCLLHYLALTDKKYRKCPICNMPVYKNDFKSVVSKVLEETRVGEEMEMQLMYCSKDTTAVKPLVCKDAQLFEWEDLYAKIIVLTNEQIMKEIIGREERELRDRYEEDKDCPEVCFIDQAFQELEERKRDILKDKARGIEDLHGAVGFSNFIPSTSEILSFNDISAADLASKELNSNNLSLQELDSTEFFSFYQSSDGQSLFLHPLNMAMLTKMFGSNSLTWPQLIQFRILEVEGLTMTEEMRKRLKFLRHLPLTTSFQLVEVDLKSFVSPHIYAEFASQLDARKKRRNSRQREERRLERANDEMMNKPPPKILSKQDFPLFGDPENFENECLEASAYPFLVDGFVEEENEDLSLAIENIRDGSYSTSPSMSFAAMVSHKSSIKKSPTFPVTKALSALTTSTHLEAHRRHSDSEDQDEYSAIPEYRASVSDAIARALETAIATKSEDGGSNQKKKKGKKSKGKILFSTGINGNGMC